MSAQLDKEASEDEELYETMVCWCKTNEKSKTTAVEDGQARDSALTELIPQLAAKSTKLTVEIEYLSKEISENEASLNTATELRSKELGEFKDSEASMMSAINGMKNAIQTLSKHHGAVLDQEVLLQVQSVLESTALPGSTALRGPAKLQRALASLIQQKKSPHQEYASQSGEILGVLKGMQESFEQNLENAKTEESDAVESYNKLKSAKTEEIADAQAQVNLKAEKKAKTDEQLSTSKEELADTRAQVSEDTEFLMDLQGRCQNMDKTMETRVTIRQQEKKAIGEAIEVLDHDDAHDHFSKTLGFVQLRSFSLGGQEAVRSKVSQVLFEAARRLRSPELATLAVSAKDDVFGKVKGTIDKLVENLKKEQADEVEMRNGCIEDFNTNEKLTADHNSYKDDLVAKIKSLTLVIEKMDDEIAVNQAEIKNTHIEIKKAGDNREKENAEFQSVVEDQRATQELIKKAIKKLDAFYGKDAIAMSGVQTQAKGKGKSGQEPPQGFGEYKKQGSADGVIGMMEMIVADSKKTETEAIAAEQEAQTAYEGFVADSNNAVITLNKAISDKKKTRAAADGDKIKSTDDLNLAEQDLADLAKVLADIHTECDYLMKNFEIKQAARTQEMESLEKSRAFMSGMTEPPVV